jgi:PAS domain S-box-containing protein
MKILSIGCLRDTLTALKAILSNALPEAILHIARNGPEGLRIARTEGPDVILLDIAAKKPCACSICRKLKDDDRLSEIPVVFMTPPGTDSESRAKAMEAGAQGFLSIPFDEIELTVMIQTMARIKVVNHAQLVQKDSVASANADRVGELELELAKHKSAGVALRQREDMFRIAAESVSNLIWDWHILDGRLEWHGPVDDLLGYAPGEFQRTLDSWEMSIHEEDRSRVMATLDLHLVNGEPYREEYRVRRRDGSYACWIDKGKAIRDSSGKPIRMIGACEDITESKQVVQELRETASYLENLIGYANAPIIVWDHSFLITRYNHAFERLTGRMAIDVVGTTLETLFPQGHASEAMALVERAQRGERWEAVEIGIRHVDGSVRTVLWNSAVVFASDGTTPMATIAQGQDITNRIQAEKDLVDLQEQLQQRVIDRTQELQAIQKDLQEQREVQRIILDSVPAWIFYKDRENRFIRVNQTFADVMDMPKDQLEGRALTDLYPKDQADDFWNDDRKVIDSGQARKNIIEPMDSLAGTRWAQTDKIPFRDSRGDIIGIIGFSVDITERKIAQDALQRSESLLNEMGRMAKVGGWEIDLLKNELSWTEAVHEIHEVEPGYRPTLETAIDFYTPEAVPVISEALRHASENGTPFDLELQLVTARKNRLWVRAIGEPIRDNGKIVRVRGMFQDINERRLAEDEIRNHRDHLEDLVNTRTEELMKSRKALVEAQAIARVGSWEWDSIKDEIRGSEEFYRLFDVTPEAISRFSLFVELLHPDDRERVQEDIAAALGQSRPYDTDYRIKLSGGGWREINARGSVFADADGAPIRMTGTCLDITERKQSEADLRVKNQVFEDSLACQSITDKDGFFTHVNPAFLKLWGFATKEEAIGRSIESFFANPEDSLPVLEALAVHDSWDGVFRARRTDGSTFLSHGYATSLLNSAGELTGYQSTNLDVTSIREAEQQLKALNESLQRSNQELEQFAYVASHDLQEPLRMVSSFTQLLAERYKDVLDQDGKEFIHYAVNGANRMQRLIQDLLAYARVTTRGQILATLDSHDALGEAIFNLQTAIEEICALVTNDDLPEIQGDRTQIVQVFQNLVGNGIKFHKRGEPSRVHVTAEPNAEQPGFWTFKVVDNGIGIEPRHFERLFVIFQRLHGKLEYPGTGIGLALCKRIVERHGGKIWLESKVGRGSTVFFTLPSAEQREGV